MAIPRPIPPLLRLPPLARRLLLIATDLLLIPLALWLSFALRLAQAWPQQLQNSLWLLPAAWLVAPLVYAYTGQYKGITRYTGSRAFYALALRNLLVVLGLYLIGKLPLFPAPPRSSWLLLWVLLTGLTGLTRLLLRDLLLNHQAASRRRQSLAVIYGAGEAGAQLAVALRFSRSHRVLAFLDDDPRLWGRHINGIPVFAPQQLPELCRRRRPPSQILLALPGISRTARRRIVDALQPSGIPVLQVPSLEEITAGRATIDALRPIPIEELLGRDAVTPMPELLAAAVQGRVVLVSGAGGSIGAELCRQILQLRPRQLVLLDNHEPSLHAIEQELRAIPVQLPLLAVLGSVTDGDLLERLLGRLQVEAVFHAAAYKHVPIVEGWPLAGLHNNVVGTLTLARAAARCGVASFTLISTDKAVRPTNVMGASKRVAELVMQAIAAEQAPPAGRTRFAMVRFGNVLGSSGSVVPVFRRQIASGGPITLTHPEVMRYFMTIPEAVQLVLQAAGLAEGGEVFLLHMGEPVRILDLATQMVLLSGLSLRDAAHPDGDIEIVCTGLRPGEKLYEELLIDADAQPTRHPLIYRANEPALAPEQLWPLLERLQQAIAAHDWPAACITLAQLVPEWQPQSPPAAASPAAGPEEPLRPELARQG